MRLFRPAWPRDRAENVSATLADMNQGSFPGALSI